MVGVVSSVEAYKKVLFHCFKHPTQAVSGFLIGRRVPEKGEDACFIVDAIPLFHTLQMTSPHPMLEVAYMQVSAYARTKGLILLGHYAANERLDEPTTSHTTQRVLDMLVERLPTSGAVLVAWQVDNRLVTPHGKEIAVKQSVYMTGGDAKQEPVSFGTWNSHTLSTEKTVSVAEVLETVGNEVDAFAHCQLVDFDEHLEDVRLNYLENVFQTK